MPWSSCSFAISILLEVFWIIFCILSSPFTKLERCQCFSVDLADPADTKLRLADLVYITARPVLRQPVERNASVPAQNTKHSLLPQVAADMSLFSGVREGPPIEVLHMKARHDRDPSTVEDNTKLCHPGPSRWRSTSQLEATRMRKGSLGCCQWSERPRLISFKVLKSLYLLNRKVKIF